MKVVITGGCGFLGQRLAALLLQKGSVEGGKVDQVILADACGKGALREPLASDPRVEYKNLDMRDHSSVTDLVADKEITSVFHLASIMSGEGEEDFDKCMEVNYHGAEAILLALKKRNDPKIRFVFTSSIAVFQPDENGLVLDSSKPLPLTTYGMTKACVEMLINDMSRRGFIDGRTARLPTVIVRPGAPNKAASSCFSGIFREPLNGVECVLPVGLDVMHPVQGYRAIVEGILHMHEIDSARLGCDRAVTLPAMGVTLGDMKEAVEAVAKDRGMTLGPIKMEPDANIAKIVAGWPRTLENKRARSLGLPEAKDLKECVVHFIEDYMK